MSPASRDDDDQFPEVVTVEGIRNFRIPVKDLDGEGRVVKIVGSTENQAHIDKIMLKYAYYVKTKRAK